MCSLLLKRNSKILIISKDSVHWGEKLYILRHNEYWSEALHLKTENIMRKKDKMNGGEKHCFRYDNAYR